MADVRYSTYRDGEYITVPPMDELCLALKDKFMRQEETIESLRRQGAVMDSLGVGDNISSPDKILSSSPFLKQKRTT